ncbi:MAG: DUF1841 domain-containing protein [Ideonella sp. MAG2]|nr:MAG: DUF1841 domain-containing protein [Ideonella sp. MAG2]
MFQPSQNDVRRFFCDTFAKQRQGQPMAPIEVLAAAWMDEHPEYHADLADVEAALAAVYTVDDGRTNPFLHLSMHLTISEQVSIDQPRGIRQAVELLAAKRNSLHEAQHEVNRLTPPPPLKNRLGYRELLCRAGSLKSGVAPMPGTAACVL